MTVNTKQVANRRTLTFESLGDIVSDVEQLGDNVKGEGNWTAGQNAGHVATMIEFSLDGFPTQIKAPLIVRMVAPMMKSRFMKKTFSPGIKLPESFKSLLAPDPSTLWETSVNRLRTVAERVEGGARMTARSPIFGKMSHEDWVRLHCRHAEMHLSFLHTG